jgi:hypothetical protein
MIAPSMVCVLLHLLVTVIRDTKVVTVNSTTALVTAMAVEIVWIVCADAGEAGVVLSVTFLSVLGVILLLGLAQCALDMVSVLGQTSVGVMRVGLVMIAQSLIVTTSVMATENVFPLMCVNATLVGRVLLAVIVFVIMIVQDMVFVWLSIPRSIPTTTLVHTTPNTIALTLFILSRMTS